MRDADKHYFPITTLLVDPGEPLPDFRVGGGLARFRGGPLLVNLYSAHCPPCLREIPVLNAFLRDAQAVHVVAISVDDVEESAHLAPQLGLAWPIVAPGGDYAYRELGIEGIPAFLLLDAHGRLLASTYANQVADATGEVTLAGLRAWIRHFLPPSTLRKAQPGEGMSAMRQR